MRVTFQKRTKGQSYNWITVYEPHRKLKNHIGIIHFHYKLHLN